MAAVLWVGKVLRIDARDWYRRKDFLAWLNSPKPIATWHTKGKPVGEYSDVFFTFDHGEGSDRDSIPEDIWQEICRMAAEHGVEDGLVWVANL